MKRSIAEASATIWLRLMASANSVVVNVLVQEPISTRVSRREQSARVGSLSIGEEVAMAVQRNSDDRSQMRRSAPSAATGVTLFLGQVRLHDAVDYSLDRCCLAARIGL
jgi:hypothetical protein